MLAVKSGALSELLPKLLDTYRAEPGAAAVDLLLCAAHQPLNLLQNGHADVAVLHLPFDSAAGLDTEILHTERQVAILPAAHPLLRPLPESASGQEATALPELHDGSLASDSDGGYPEGAGPQVRDLTQLFQLIALGRTVYGQYPESIVYRPAPGPSRRAGPGCATS